MILLNGCEIEPTIFPDGTSQMWKYDDCLLIDGGIDTVHWYFEREEELAWILQLGYHSYFNLVMPYLPYARQDHGYNLFSTNRTFALFPFLNALMSADYARIFTFDAHSPSIKKYEKITNRMPVFYSLFSSYDILIFPDKGAKDRYINIPEAHQEIYYGDKVRNQGTGYITHYDLHGRLGGLKDKEVLVIDDLCDGGMTFKILAESLKKEGVANADLYVSHGVFSKGFAPILEDYRHIYTTDSYMHNHKLKEVEWFKSQGQLTIMETGL